MKFNSTSSSTSTIRWKPLLSLIVITSAVVLFIQNSERFPQQQQNLYSAVAAIIGFVLFLCWTIFISRLRWKVRFLIVGVSAAMIAFCATTLKIEGVSGDLVPIVTWKWSKSPSERAAQLSDSSSAADANIAGRELPENFSAYAQFLGPNRTGILDGPVFESDWKTRPPKELWRRDVGPAWSGFAIKGFRAVTQEQRGGQEVVTCYDLLTGDLLWTHADATQYNTVIAGEGPRATPTITDGRVYTVGATGILNCLELETGAPLWQRNVLDDAAAAVPEWGLAGSPLVTNDLVIVNAGGVNNRSMIAYDRADGEIVWTGGNGPAGYSSPFLTTLAGAAQVLIFNHSGIASHDLESGNVLWSFPVASDHPHVAMPLVLEENRVMVSSGYGNGSVMLQINKDDSGTFAAKQLWKTNRLKSKFNNMIQLNGYVYALDDGILACINAASGERLWKDGRFGHGQMILANERQMLLTAETGGLVLIGPSPDGLQVKAQIQAFDEKVWNSPALAGNFLLLRNHKEAVCYQLSEVGETGGIVSN